jgi:hypothetical protein
MRPHRPLDLSLSGVRNESSRSSRGFLFCAVFLLRTKSTLTVRRARAFSGWKRMRYDGTAKLQRKLRRVAVQIWMISTGLLVAVAPVEHARGGELMDCEPQHVRGDGRHWAYRILDGRQCWYPGQAGKPKDELRWREAPSATVLDQPEIEARAPAQAPQTADVVEQAEAEASLRGPILEPPAASPESVIKLTPDEARAADQLLAFTCCWPDLPTAVSVPQPGPGGRQDQPPAWPLILLPLGLCAMWSKKLRRLLATDFARSSGSSWWRWWRVAVRRGAHNASGERRPHTPAGGVTSSPTNAPRPTKLARIDGTIVPLAPRSLPPASRIAGSFRSSAKAGDWRRMRFLLTDRSDVANDPLVPAAHVQRAVRADYGEGPFTGIVRDSDARQDLQTPLATS